MSMREELLSIERELWSGGAEAYHAHVDDRCLVAFTGMAGVMTREEVAGTVTDGPRWRDVEIDVEGLLEPTADTAVLTYRASARRGESESYRALVSSGYARRDGAWKLVFHQQTPVAGDDES